MTITTKVSLILPFAIFVTNVLADESASGSVFVKTRQDIDYHLDTLGVSFSLISPAGLFGCTPGFLSGETRIDSFNNIVGIGDVRRAEWKDFTARDIECRYGAKWATGTGVFKAGIGFRDYHGETAEEPGGKDISIQGVGALLSYAGNDLDARLEWTREIHDYTLKHQSSYANYDGLLDATEDTYVGLLEYRRLYLKVEHVTGNKDNVYTTALFASNQFRYAYTDISPGLRFEPAGNGLTLVAPVFGEGSYRGSFNPMRGAAGLKGVRLEGRISGFDVDLEFVRHKGQGDRPYMPATNKLTERKDLREISLGISSGDWDIELLNESFVHSGHATIATPLYALMLGGYGPYHNERKEDKWTLSLSMPLYKKVSVDFSVYHTTRHDRQYNHPEHDYTEGGGFLQFKFNG